MFKKVFITGGSGDLGALLLKHLSSIGQPWVNYDISTSCVQSGSHVLGDITDETLMTHSMIGCDVVVHIAALHGIHEIRGVDRAEFHRVNVVGTRTVLDCMRKNNIHKLVFLSSESVNKPETVYGQTKIECERMIDGFCTQTQSQAVSLRCRSFIPSSNINVYANQLQWLEYFCKGGVHVMDVLRSVLCALQYVRQFLSEVHTKVTIDGKYEFTGTTTISATAWQTYVSNLFGGNIPPMFAFVANTVPKIKVDNSSYPNAIGYTPIFSIREAIEEVKHLQY